MSEPTFEQLKESNQKLSKILEIGKYMSTQRDLDTLLKIIVKETSEILEADRTSLFMYDEDHHELWLKLSEKQEINEIRFGANKGIAGHVANTQKIMSIDNAYEHELFNSEIDEKTGFKTTSLLSAPIENLQGKLIGVIQVLNKRSGNFTDSDREILMMFTSLAAILLENSILEEENLKKERMAMVGNMASTIIHDIKNPMTSIRGLAEIIAMDSPENAQHANVIVKSVDRLMNMTEELLDFSKGIEQSIKFEATNCNDFFSETFEFIENELEENNIEFIHEINYSGNIEINPDKIQRAIYNFTGNSRDAMKNGGKLEIDVSESDDKSEIIITFSDTGSGIPEEIKDTLFDAFVTCGKKNGTGLGMAISKRIIDAHNGKISVESEKNIGTTFKITLPKHQ